MSLLAFWSPKGGSGTSVTAAAVAVQAARVRGPVRLVDLCGDLPAVLATADKLVPPSEYVQLPGWKRGQA